MDIYQQFGSDSFLLELSSEADLSIHGVSHELEAAGLAKVS